MRLQCRAGLAGVFSLALAAQAASAQGDPARAFDPTTAATRKQGTTVRIELVGDSTQTLNAGYGRGFCANLTAAADCVDMAKGGASTRTYREQGLWQQALAEKPDYMLIQFGHNDLVTPEHLPRQVPLPEYTANLKRMVTEARAAGIKPVLVTPLSRRYFEADGKVHSDLLDYSKAMKTVAQQMDVPLIDLQGVSIFLLNLMGEKEASTLGLYKKDASGQTVPDKTHLNWKGSYVFGRVVAEGLKTKVPALAAYIRPEAARVPPEGEKALRILAGGPVKIVLVGDSTVATGGGWGPGFCAAMTANVTCDDVALNGRSTKSFLDEGAWAKALALHGDYYLIQFGHNDQKDDPARHTDPQGSFQVNLRKMVAEVRGIGAVPVLVTSLSRRTYKDGKVVQDLNAYAQATREMGAQEGITVIDLNAMSTRLLDTMTQAQADEFDAVGHADAKAEGGGAAGASAATPKLDRTHLNPKGQALFGRMVADALVKTEVSLGPDLKPNLAPNPAPASGPALKGQPQQSSDDKPH